MQGLSDLERAVLAAIAEQVPEHASALRAQVSSAHVAARENTGAGFYTKLAIADGPKMDGAPSPIGDIGVDVEGMEHGLGFLLWLRDGVADTLECYSYDDTTEGLELTRLLYSNLGPRLR